MIGICALESVLCPMQKSPPIKTSAAVVCDLGTTTVDLVDVSTTNYQVQYNSTVLAYPRWLDVRTCCSVPWYISLSLRVMIRARAVAM